MKKDPNKRMKLNKQHSFLSKVWLLGRPSCIVFQKHHNHSISYGRNLVVERAATSEITWASTKCKWIFGNLARNCRSKAMELLKGTIDNLPWPPLPNNKIDRNQIEYIWTKNWVGQIRSTTNCGKYWTYLWAKHLWLRSMHKRNMTCFRRKKTKRTSPSDQFRHKICKVPSIWPIFANCSLLWLELSINIPQDNSRICHNTWPEDVRLARLARHEGIEVTCDRNKKNT